MLFGAEERVSQVLLRKPHLPVERLSDVVGKARQDLPACSE
jgi:hypothetical protein